MTDTRDVVAAVDLLRIRTAADAEFLAAAEQVVAELKRPSDPPTP